MDDLKKISMNFYAYLLPLLSVLIWYISAYTVAHVADNATQNAQRASVIGVWVGLFISVVSTASMAYYFYSTTAALVFLTAITLVLCLTIILIANSKRR